MTTETAAPAKGRPKKPRSRVGFITPGEEPDRAAGLPPVPPLIQAASITLTLLRHMKANSLDELQDQLFGISHSADADYDHTFFLKAADLYLTEEQDHLLGTFQPILRLLRITPGISVAVCPECMSSPVAPSSDPTSFHGWQLVGSGQPPTTCKVTLGCPGKPVKASAAKKHSIPGEQPADSPDTDTA